MFSPFYSAEDSFFVISLKYVKSAKAATDVPTTVPEFISQRRRWLNGSLFASIHATVFFFRIWTSGQNFFRKIVLQVRIFPITSRLPDLVLTSLHPDSDRVHL